MEKSKQPKSKLPHPSQAKPNPNLGLGALLLYKNGADTRDRPIIGFTDLFNRYRYRLIGIDTHHIGIGMIGIGMV